jgi:DNA-binding MarR family transcriptional regulator
MGFREELERRKRASLGQLLLRGARLFHERAIAKLGRRRPEVRAAHTQLYPHIDLEGTRLSELARRVGTSKQAVGQLVSELEAAGVLRRDRDPEDARAKRVSFTPRGRRALLHGLGVLGGIAGELEAELGRARLRRLREDLALLVDALERYRDRSGSSPVLPPSRGRPSSTRTQEARSSK